MVAVDIKDVTGSKTGTIDLDPKTFGLDPNVAVMHQVVTAQLAARRSGTQSTKTRAEVRGGGAKPWRQRALGALDMVQSALLSGAVAESRWAPSRVTTHRRPQRKWCAWH